MVEPAVWFFVSVFCSPELMFRFLQMKVLLQTLRPNDLALLESLPERWKSLESPDGEQRITGNIN